MSDDKLHADITRGQRARLLLDEPLLIEAFAKLEATYIEAWRNTGAAADQTNAREKLWQAVQIVGKVQQHLLTVLDNGKLARAELDSLIDKKPKRFGIV